MVKKGLLLILSSFTLNVIISCTCNFDDLDTNPNSHYSGVRILGIDTSGFEDSRIDKSIYKSDLGLRVYTEYERDLAEISPKRSSGSFISSSYACSEPDVFPNITDPISTIEIFMNEVITNATKDVTLFFEVIDYNNNKKTIKDFIINSNKNNRFRIDSFQLEPAKESFLTDSVTFTIVMQTRSGEMIVGDTDIITFIE